MINAHVVDLARRSLQGHCTFEIRTNRKLAPRDEVTEHMAGARKAMQQQQRLRVRRSGFAIENIEALRKWGHAMSFKGTCL